ncbi:MAG: LAGLIDADG family homing endonuclease [Infirmifilum sp.]
MERFPSSKTTIHKFKNITLYMGNLGIDGLWRKDAINCAEEWRSYLSESCDDLITKLRQALMQVPRVISRGKRTLFDYGDVKISTDGKVTILRVKGQNELATKLKKLKGTANISSDFKYSYLLGWLASDAYIEDIYVKVGTTQFWQLSKLTKLFNLINIRIKGFSLTKKGLKPIVEIYWRLDTSWWNVTVREAVSALNSNPLIQRAISAINSRIDVSNFLSDWNRRARRYVSASLLNKSERDFGAFMLGLIEGDGHVNEKYSYVSITIGDEKLAIILVALMWKFGFTPRIYRRRRYYLLNIYKRQLRKLVTIIPPELLTDSPKAEKLVKIGSFKWSFSVRKTSTSINVITSPKNQFQTYLTVEKLKEIGLTEKIHFTFAVPSPHKSGRVTIKHEGLRYLAYLAYRKNNKKAQNLLTYLKEQAHKTSAYHAINKIIEEGQRYSSRDLPEDITAEALIDGNKLRINIKPHNLTITFRIERKNTIVGEAPARKAVEERKHILEKLLGRDVPIKQHSFKLSGGDFRRLLEYKQLFDTMYKWYINTPFFPHMNTATPSSSGASSQPWGR